MRYGERLATGMLTVERHVPNHWPPPEPTLRRNPSWHDHQLNMPLTGMLVGKLNVSLLEGNGVKQLFLNLHYLFPRTYLVACRSAPRLTPIRITGKSYFINEQSAGAVAHVRDVFEDRGENPIPLWALQAIDHYHAKPWPVVRTYSAADAVGAFQRAVSRDTVAGIQRVYDELAMEYGYIDYRQFDWHQFQPNPSQQVI